MELIRDFCSYLSPQWKQYKPTLVACSQQYMEYRSKKVLEETIVEWLDSMSYNYSNGILRNQTNRRLFVKYYRGARQIIITRNLLEDYLKSAPANMLFRD